MNMIEALHIIKADPTKACRPKDCHWQIVYTAEMLAWRTIDSGGKMHVTHLPAPTVIFDEWEIVERRKAK